MGGPARTVAGIEHKKDLARNANMMRLPEWKSNAASEGQTPALLRAKPAVGASGCDGGESGTNSESAQENFTRDP
jgi:hypothetical protein